MAKKDWSEFLGEFRDEYFTKERNPSFAGIESLSWYDRLGPQKAVKRFNLDEVNDGILARINALGLGIAINRISVREGTPEEIKSAQGRYLNGEILINPMYTDHGGDAILSADFYDQNFTRNHLESQGVEDLREDRIARMRHLVEDIVAHEYGHHVFKNVYRDELQREAAKSEGNTEGRYIPTHSFEEGFARWFNAAVVGHIHISDKSDLIFWGEDDEFYSNKAGILQAYDALTKAAKLKGVREVLENLTRIGVPIVVDLKRKQEQRMRERYKHTHWSDPFFSDLHSW